MNKKFLVIIFLFLVFVLGFFANILYMDMRYDRIYNGLDIRDVTKSTAYNVANKMEDKGNWICINVRGMDWDTAIATCNHEIAHEIFAKYCEKNITKCMEIN